MMASYALDGGIGTMLSIEVETRGPGPARRDAARTDAGPVCRAAGRAVLRDAAPPGRAAGQGRGGSRATTRAEPSCRAVTVLSKTRSSSADIVELSLEPIDPLV